MKGPSYHSGKCHQNQTKPKHISLNTVIDLTWSRGPTRNNQEFFGGSELQPGSFPLRDLDRFSPWGHSLARTQLLREENICSRRKLQKRGGDLGALCSPCMNWCSLKPISSPSPGLTLAKEQVLIPPCIEEFFLFLFFPSKANIQDKTKHKTTTTKNPSYYQEDFSRV